MRRFLAAVVILTLALPAYSAAAHQADRTAGSIDGTASSSTGQLLANRIVQLRNIDTGRLVGSSTSSSVGAFSFAGLEPGNYVVEVVNTSRQVVGTSAVLFVAAGTAITGIAVSASTATVTSGLAASALVAIIAATAAGVATAAVVATRDTTTPAVVSARPTASASQ